MVKKAQKSNGFDLSQFDDVQAAQNEGITLQIVHPGTGEDLGVTFVVAGPDSDAARAADRRMTNRRLKGRKTSQLTAEELQEETLRKLAACVLSWDGMVDKGVPLDLTVKNAIMVFERAPWLVEQVAGAASDRAAFFTV